MYTDNTGLRNLFRLGGSQRPAAKRPDEEPTEGVRCAGHEKKQRPCHHGAHGVGWRQGVAWNVLAYLFLASTAAAMSAKIASTEPTPLMLTAVPSFL